MRGVTESAVNDIYRHIDNVSFEMICAVMKDCFLTCPKVLITHNCFLCRLLRGNLLSKYLLWKFIMRL